MGAAEGKHTESAPKAALLLGALGVVFGDIGTSPLYAVQTVFAGDALRPVAVQQTSIYGIVSLIFWSVTAIVSVMYLLLFMRADNDGEGGLLSLVALLRQRRLSPKLQLGLATMAVFGAALFFGDSMITPAISVLSAMEGLEIIDPGLEKVVVPGALVILVGLFAFQRFGTARVGRLFGPIMVVWFVALALCGIRGVARHPEVLQALSPHWAARYLIEEPLTAFLSLGAVVLVITGAEALYADMGHFGKRPIRRAWFFVAFPALVLNYLGQGAFLIDDPSGAGNPFFLLVPHWARIPMVALATLATIIASQAVISGAFSVARQATRLGYLPRLRVRHTSTDEPGQIYVPFVNWLLMAAVLGLVIGFQSSSRLAAAYGVAVIGTITVTTALFFVLQWVRAKRPPGQIIAVGVFFLLFVLVFLAANLVKVGEGGWLPIAIGSIIFVVLTTWRRGRELADAGRSRLEGPLQDFVHDLHSHEIPVQRVPGCAVFLSRGEGTTPMAMRANVEHNHSLHSNVIVLTLNTPPVPRVAPEERLKVDDLGFRDDGISQVTATFGYEEPTSLPEILRLAQEYGLEGGQLDLDTASFFVSAPELRITDSPGMAQWRKHLFAATTRVTADPIEFFDLPRGRTVSMGAEIEI
ncbi:MAG: potassium transporter Kup [Thermoleophilaceae bacterium]